MPYQNSELLSAIDRGDIGLVQTILADRDPNGVPYANINDGSYVNSALLYALATGNNPNNQTEKTEICLALLNVRDNNNSPVINLNAVTGHGQTALTWVIRSSYLTVQQKRLLTDRIVNLRGAQGELIYDVSTDACNIKPLKSAVETGDIEIVRMLLDLRNADGTFAIDVNEITHNTTALDYATEGSYNRQPSPDIQQELRNAGGFTRAELDDMTPAALAATRRRINRPLRNPLNQQNNNNIPAPRERFTDIIPAMRVEQQEKSIPDSKITLEEKAKREIAQFNQNTQNTHDEHTETSVANSIKRLTQRYPNVDITGNLNKLSVYLNSLPSSHPKKSNAIESFKRIKLIIGTHSETGLTLQHILALVWNGINDKQAPPIGQKIATETIIKLRKESLLDKLFEIYTEYDWGPSCTGGTRNQIVKSLDKAHPDVEIIVTETGVQLSALEYAQSVMQNALQEKSEQEQRQILKSWKSISHERDESMEEKESQASSFHRSMKEDINTKLKAYFGRLLTAPILDAITGTAHYKEFPCPIVHEKLQTLLDTIYQVEINNNSSEEINDRIEILLSLPRQRLAQIKQLNKENKELISLCDRVIEKASQFSADFSTEKIKTDLDEIIELLDSIEKASGQKIQLNGLKKYQESLKTVGTIDLAIEKINQYIKQKAESLFDEERTLAGDYEYLNKQYDAYNKILEFLNLPKDNNALRNQAISKIYP